MAGFWTGTGDSLAEPKRKFRFKVHFGSLNGSAFWVKTVNKPTFTINAAEHKYLNYVFYYPGNVTWNEITLTGVDPIDPDLAETLAQALTDAGYVLPGTPSEPKTISKRAATATLGEVYIEQYDAGGSVVEKWTLHNAWIREVKFGDLEYGADDLTQVDIIMKYDWATLGTDPGTALLGMAAEK